jgi:hypothetical protein
MLNLVILLLYNAAIVYIPELRISQFLLENTIPDKFMKKVFFFSLALALIMYAYE